MFTVAGKERAEMNILAEKQKQIFEKGIPEEEREKRISEFNKLYYQLRHKDETGFFGRMSLKTRKRLHKAILMVYRIKNRIGGFSYEVLSDERAYTSRPIIFAVTHIGKFDIEVLSEAIKDHYYLLSGDYEHIQGIIDAPFIATNGVIYFNERVKEDRAAVSMKMIKHLQGGGNLMYFPEGTWNVTPNLPMLPCYWGIVEVAQKGNAMIIPVAGEQYGKHFKVRIGKNIDMLQFGSSKEEKSKAIEYLRDTLATLKWEIWETESQRRSELGGNEWTQYQEERFREWPYFSLEYIEPLIFKPKGITAPTEAFEHLSNLLPNRNNAFLLRSSYSGNG